METSGEEGLNFLGLVFMYLNVKLAYKLVTLMRIVFWHLRSHFSKCTSRSGQSLTVQ